MVHQRSIRIVDSHTAGEPTRVVIDGGPKLTGRTAFEKREELRRDHDWLRTCGLSEPRGYEAMVGALLCESDRDDCVAGGVFFNSVGYLNGCIHGTIGLVQTLVHLGIISAGDHGIETPAGRVTAQVDDSGSISVRNVPSYRIAAGVSVSVPDWGTVVGDIAWGGNWFFLVNNTSGFPLHLEHAGRLTQYAIAIRQSLADQGIVGTDSAEIDHVEIFDSPSDPASADSKNFVLCPSNAYDRSPCGTGTSAKLACLFSDGRLHLDQTWRQAGILDTRFYGSVEMANQANDIPPGSIIPTIKGQAFVNGELTLIINSADPFRFGIPYHQASLNQKPST
ncbi:proline racemase family protein [Planctomycetes bacterium CA13]